MADTTHPHRDVLPLPEEPTVLGPRPAPVPASAVDLTRGFEGRLPLPLEDTLRDPARASSGAAARPRVLGEYELLGELARGGMGAVYRAIDRRLGREVAIKVVLSGGAADPEERERFEVEARAAARLKHPNIVGIHRVGEERGAPYLVMDLVPGESLHKRITRDGPLGPRDAARIGARLARALAFAHGRGVLHRDLKPHNVLLTPEGEPILTDFGLAKEVEQSRELTVTGQVLGTPAYMAPEQARGDNERVDRRADVYGFGATLYAALTGRPPFQARSAIALLAKVVEEPVVPPRRTRPEVDVDLETIVLRCLEKEPGARDDTAQDLADDLERYLAGEPILARRRGALERAVRWVTRHRLATAGAVGALALALVAGVGARLAEQGRVMDAAREAAVAARAAAEDASIAAVTSEALLELRIERALLWLQAAQRWSDLAGTAEARDAQVAAALALSAVAGDGAQWGSPGARAGSPACRTTTRASSTRCARSTRRRSRPRAPRSTPWPGATRATRRRRCSRSSAIRTRARCSSWPTGWAAPSTCWCACAGRRCSRRSPRPTSRPARVGSGSTTWPERWRGWRRRRRPEPWRLAG